MVQPEAVAVDEFVLDAPRLHLLEFLFGGKAGQRPWPGTDEIAYHVRWPDLQPRHLPVVVHGRDGIALQHIIVGQDGVLLHLWASLGVQVGDLQQRRLAQRFCRNAHLLGQESGSG